MASEWTGGGGRLYEACRLVTEEGDSEMLLNCVLKGIEMRQDNLEFHANAFLLVISGAIVFFMQAGFAMLCAGSVRKKNTHNTMLKNLLDACGAAIAYFSVGYAFAFGGDATATGTTFAGTENFFGTGDIHFPSYFFQYTFAAACVTIVAGSLAERCQMAAYLCYSMYLTSIVYPIASHAVWSKAGFLSWSNADPLFGIGMIDYAGGGVIHFTGGTTALIACYLLGSRRGRFFDLRTGEPLEKPKPMPGHSVSLQVLGTFILWFGWFGFNAGSTLLLTGNPNQGNLAAHSAVNTFLSSAGGCISSMLIRCVTTYREANHVVFDLSAAMNGMLTGLVSITAACGTLEPWAALVVGFVAGALYIMTSNALLWLKIDDVVDGIPVHFSGGFWSIIATGLFSDPELIFQVTGTRKHPGFFYSLSEGHSDARLLACQVMGALFIFGWTLITMLPFFLTLNAFSWLRTEAVEEIVGLDMCYNAMGEPLENSVAGSDEALRDEFLMAFEEHKLKHKQNKRRGSGAGSGALSLQSSQRSEGGGGGSTTGR